VVYRKRRGKGREKTKKACWGGRRILKEAANEKKRDLKKGYRVPSYPPQERRGRMSMGGGRKE